MTKKVYKQKYKNIFLCHNLEFKLGNVNYEFSYF